MKKQYKVYILSLLVAFALIFAGCGTNNERAEQPKGDPISASNELQNDNLEATAEDEISASEIQALLSTPDSFDPSSIPEYSGSTYVAVNNNVPFFTDEDLIATSFEKYSDLDSKGRCGVCVASVGKDIMPTEKRGEIGDVKPSGWKQKKYAGLVDGNYLYNRCHLIGYQLTGENANEKNLITGTRYFNTEGMLPFENMVADYVKETGNHVLYRVTPIFEEDNLLAHGVLMEAKSVEDEGDGVLYCVFCYNVQPGIFINYATGENRLADTETEEQTKQAEQATEQTSVSTLENTEELTPEVVSVQTVAEASVWITETGSKYHSKNNCGKINPSKATQVTESQATSMGLEKCSKCW